MSRLVNPFDLPGRWYKANLHTHTTVSDGTLPPAQRVAQYRDAGYDVLALTDHGVTNDVSPFTGGRMLVISGIEMHPPCPSLPGSNYHLVGLGVPRGFALSDPKDANRCIADVTAVGGITFLGHPYWCGQSLKDFRDLKGLSAIEVFNSTCDNCGRGSSEHEWDNAVDSGMVLPCLGVDDTHQREPGEEIFEAWTWLKMPSLSVDNVLEAIRIGACYASRGPTIQDFGVANGRLHIKCSPAAAIYFKAGVASGQRRRAPAGETIDFFDKPLNLKEKYVRAVVIDPQGRQAWTNPIFMNQYEDALALEGLK
ncbi:MAG: CehA/McbA family metallohydrolase [Phycisphaerae bacterium]